jgi:ferrous iron transport protein B
MLITAFFQGSRGPMLFLIWFLSWIFALGSAWCLRRWVIKGPQTPFVMELPIYHMPTLKGVLMDTWHRTFLYIKKAATVILAMSVVLWALMYFPRLPEDKNADGDGKTQAQARLRHSFAGRLGEGLVPLSRLAGFDWRDNIALIGGFAAKEVVLGTLATAYAMGENPSDEGGDSLSSRLAADPSWNRLRAFVLMVFVMAYAPCLATLAAIRKETNSWSWAIFSTVYSTTAAFIVAVLIFQIGNLLNV